MKAAAQALYQRFMQWYWTTPLDLGQYAVLGVVLFVLALFMWFVVLPGADHLAEWSSR